ncbi:P110/LppT family adhesin N-terminal domain [Mycoplasma sp. 'Moose RK']|uniref:P110/LppT family adhesin N-terminal domain n=1 Tax=Mycoplasma sp. 'Moose RK' TaxID=2780095 RepID=UPI0018C28A4E|nr:P110/LppT family adhesin N-terminal domain [Mycoplasma sp. 'Moose RK']MBG0731096.1 P110/LppT family adhesin N-terminal domain [Mycoplasma sp. 'Moose RK']
MNKQIRNKVLILLAGLTFIGVTAGAGIGVQKAALRSSYLKQFDNDKSESALNPVASETDLANAISSFSLKKEWSTISATQAFDLHKNPLYAFKLSDAVDFSKLDSKFANLFFNVQVNEKTAVSGTSINNLVVFVFDKKNKEQVANRAFNLNLSGFAASDNQALKDNFVDKNSTFEINYDTNFLKRNFPTGAILPSAFAIKFQDQLINNLRGLAPESFVAPQAVAERVNVSAFKDAGTITQAGENGQASGGSGGGTSTGGSGGSGSSVAPATPAPAPADPAPAAPAPEATPKEPEVVLPTIESSKLKEAFTKTLKEFGSLKLVSTSGLQSLISDNYSLLPVASKKSFVKIGYDDQNGTATISLKLVDKNQKEKNLDLNVSGFTSLIELKNKITEKVLKNQLSYFSLLPKVVTYLQKNPNFKIATIANVDFDQKIWKLYQDYRAAYTDVANSDPNTKEQNLKKMLSFANFKKEILNRLSKEPVKIVEPKPEVDKDDPTLKIPAETLLSDNTPATITFFSELFPKKALPSGVPLAAPGKELFYKTSIEFEKKIEELIKPYREIYSASDSSSHPKDGSGNILSPSNFKFWFKIANTNKFNLDGYDFNFSVAKYSESAQKSPADLPVNIEIYPKTDLRLQINPKNIQYLDIDTKHQKVYDFGAGNLEKKEHPLVKDPSLAWFTPIESPTVFSTVEYSGWSFPITINALGPKAQQELTKLLGNDHETALTNQGEKPWFVSDIEQIFKKANLENYLQLSGSAKTDAQNYLKSALNGIAEQVVLPPEPKKEIKKEDKEKKTEEEKKSSTPPSTSGAGSAGTSRSTTTSTASTQPVSAQLFQESPAAPAPAKPADQPKMLPFGDYLIKYLDKFATYKVESGQKLAIKGEYDPENLSYNFVFQVLDSKNEPIASIPFKLRGVGVDNYAFKKSLAFSPDVFVDGRSGIKYNKNQAQGLRSLNDSGFSYVVNNESQKTTTTNNKANVLNQNGIAVHSPLTFDYQKAGSDLTTPLGPINDKKRTSLTTLRKGVLYFVFTPEAVLRGEQLSFAPYKLLSSPGRNVANSNFGSSSLMLIKQYPTEIKQNQGIYNSITETETVTNNNLLLVWNGKGVASLQAGPDDVIDKSGGSGNFIGGINKGFVAIHDSNDKNDQYNPEITNRPWSFVARKSLFDYSVEKPATTDQNTKDFFKLNKQFVERFFNNISDADKSKLNLNLHSLGSSKSDKNKLTFPNGSEKFLQTWLSDNENIKQFIKKYPDQLEFIQQPQKNNESLENYLGKTWLLEVVITEDTVKFTIIPDSAAAQKPIWTSTFKSVFNDHKLNINPSTPVGALFGRGFDYGQIGDKLIDFDSDGSYETAEKTGQQSGLTTRPENGITFKALAVFKDENLARDEKSRVELRKVFMKQYFKWNK